MATAIGPRIGVDVGGTFTDLVAVHADGHITTRKVPSTPDDPARALWDAVDAAGVAVATLVHGSTVATNALLERRGARVVLVTTAGFEDLLWLRRQERAALYNLATDHPPPLVARDDVVGVAERVGADRVVLPLTDAEVDRVVRAVVARAPEAVAVGLLFGFRDPSHEQRVATALTAALPDVPVVTSHAVLPAWREYERFATTTAEAFLRPPVGRYLERLGAEGARRGVESLRIMASHGGTLSVAQAATHAAQLALSGPAGGVEAARQLAGLLGRAGLLTLDMGGTSTDVSVVRQGAAAQHGSGEVGGVPLALPQVLIETVGAGGGSIGWVDAGGALRVGPRSAGAVPGPACYGRGGTEPTLTDAAVVLRWLDPAVPLAGSVRLNAAAAEAAVARLAGAAHLTVTRCAEGMVEVTVATMVRALRRVSVERGIDPRTLDLCAFGGAGPLLVCRLADGLGVDRAMVPPYPGVFSAVGLAVAAPRLEMSVPVHRSVASVTELDLAALTAPARRVLANELPDATITLHADCRYPGQGMELTVPCATPADAAEAFHALHRGRYGHADPASAVEIINLRVRADGAAPAVTLTADRDVGRVVRGPATLALPDATVRIEAGWTATVHATGAFLLERV
ncbi:MAG: hydantoinase/oxoprolinase family protein [Gemmatimonadales bacterium]